MQLVVLQLISGMVNDAIRHVCGSIGKAWAEVERAKKGELLLSPVELKERSYRKRII